MGEDEGQVMTNPVALLRTTVDIDGNYLGKSLLFWCPGCASYSGHGGLHALPVEGTEQPQWYWNGNLELPTLEPSILTQSDYGDPPVHRVCHSFLRDGVWDFLSDSTHVLAGQKVPMEPLPDWYVR
jgi:hypothetical protein